MSNEITFSHRLERAPLIKDRDTWILDRCAGKRSLHIGCVDSGMLGTKIKDNTLLHARLTAISSRAMGVDIDSSGIEDLKAHKFSNVICADVASDHESIIAAVSAEMVTCDVIVCGEVLEHVTNQGSFLAGIRKVAEAFDSEIIFTVPNAYAFDRFLKMFCGVEAVHSDHKCYFSEITLKTLLRQTGFAITDCRFYSNEKRASSLIRHMTKWAINRTILSAWPQLSSGVAATAKVQH